MTDLEITKLCAEAMGIEHRCVDNVYVECRPNPPKDPRWWDEYRPLHDDAQAMALVKRFKLELYCEEEHDDLWLVAPSTVLLSYLGHNVMNIDLNRAICECCARMQLEKNK
jgi:hypothetical protein